MFVKNKSLVNAIKKAGYTVETTRDDHYSAKNGRAVLSWHLQGDYAICVLCSVLGDQRDTMTDYFPGYYARTIKLAVNHLHTGEP